MSLLKRFARGAGLAMIVIAGVAAAPTVATATPVVGHVYVNDNTAVTNTIGAFDQHADGSLTAMAGSPFAAGGFRDRNDHRLPGRDPDDRRRGLGARGRRRQ